MACADLLACPECARPLAADGHTLRCPHGHAFDIARQGYVSLLTGASTKMTGDTPAMLDARAAFQSAGHFAPIATALVRAVRRGHRVSAPGSTAAAYSSTRLAGLLLADDEVRGGGSPGVLEIGAGTGYYLAAVLDALPQARGIALDVSKPAAKRSARAHARAGAVLADAWRGLPVRDGAMGTVLSVFAPRNPDEVARVLTADGRFIVATPTARHLGELIEPLGMVRVDAAKQERLAESLGGRFELLERTEVEYSMPLTHADISAVAGMGPSAFHAAADRAERIAALPDPLPVTASVTVSSYRRR
ncbi:putative RNA methyltransferase [Nocardia inohanensis]|uniref:putative RNA methyltransferase n=1 Tax=Nocardia inohanensis TaxID=209246 RepID=UPI00082EB4C8|nr:methyltransferase domain-containing protein [Nocardia inohanensis]